MLRFQSIKDLTLTLNTNHQILSDLFLKRHINLGIDTFRNALDARQEQNLEKLILRNIVVEEAGLIRLDEGLIDFFELVMDAQTTVSVGIAQDYVDKIRSNKQYYLDEKREKKRIGYLRKVKNNLRNVDRAILGQVRLLQKNINNAYMTETNLKVKLSKLGNLTKQRDQIGKLQKALYKILDDKIFFEEAMDVELRSITIHIKQSLEKTDRNLMNIQKNILRYIRKAKEQSIALEHLQKVKILKDQLDLRAKSNIETVLRREHSLAFEGDMKIYSRLSLEQLVTDEGHAVILKTHQKNKIQHQVTLKMAQPIPSDFLEKKMTTKPMINMKQLKTLYQGQGGDLYSFIQEHEFKEPIEREERLGLYCKMIALFDNELNITTEMQQDEDVRYAMVYLKA